jgi:hypothetical protein
MKSVFAPGGALWFFSVYFLITDEIRLVVYFLITAEIREDIFIRPCPNLCDFVFLRSSRTGFVNRFCPIKLFTSVH